jgi:putative ABC transport system substrate-binding protein
MKFRIAAVLLALVAILTSPDGTGEAWAQANLPRVGILTFASATDNPAWEIWFEPFRRTLADRGWIEGKDVSFEYRSANSDPSQITEAATSLVSLKVDVIFAIGTPLVRAAHAATRTIPIVASDYTTDPVAEGYAKSYARPDGNVTGVFLDAPEFAGKWFELLKAMVPDLSRVSVLWDPAPGANHVQAVRNVARSLDIKLQVLEVRMPSDIDTAFSALHGPPQAIIILPSPMTYGQSPRLARLALTHRLPATSMARGFAIAGGAITYGPDLKSAWESIAVLVAKILDGSKPAEIPIERPTKIQLLVNLKTAKALGIKIPQSILLRADEVFE